MYWNMKVEVQFVQCPGILVYYNFMVDQVISNLICKLSDNAKKCLSHCSGTQGDNIQQSKKNMSS